MVGIGTKKQREFGADAPTYPPLRPTRETNRHIQRNLWSEADSLALHSYKLQILMSRLFGLLSKRAVDEIISVQL